MKSIRLLNKKHLPLIITFILILSFSLIAPIQAQSKFELRVEPFRQTIAPGMSTAYTILITSISGFNSPVSLKIENEDDLPSSITAVFSTNTVTPPKDGVGYAILTVATKTTSSRKEYTIEISGRGDGTTESTSVILEITKKSTFAIDVSPFSQTIGLEASKEFQVTVSSLGTFEREVDLEIDRVPYGISYEFIPSTVEPTEGGSVVSTLKVYISEDVDPSVYALIVRGSSTTEDEFSFVVVEVPKATEFLLTVTPIEETVKIDKSISFTIEAKSVGGFRSDIKLYLENLPSGISFSFDPEIIKPTPTKIDSSTLKFTISKEATKGDYEIDVKGSSLDLIKTSTIKVEILPITTDMTCKVLLSKVKKGDTIGVEGEISESIADARIKLVYSRPDGTQFTRFVTTNVDGFYSDSYKPDFTALAPQSYIGEWQVSAEWEGNNVFEGSKSSMVYFEVVELTFLEKYGLTFLYDYALWIGIILVIVVIVIVLSAYAYKRAPPPEKKPTEIVAAPAVEEKKPPAVMPERAVERITEKPTERVIERVVERPVERIIERPPKEIKKGKAPPLILPRKKCFNCKTVISAQAKFCDNCRAPQPEKIKKKDEAPPLILARKYCSNCGEIISEKAKFCDKCKSPQK